MGWLQKLNPGHAAELRMPLARTEELVVEQVGDELLVYDQRSNRAHCLSGAAAAVWRASDGRTTMDNLSARLELDRETVMGARDELDACELLDSPQPAGVTRREATVRMAKVGAAAAAAPLIYSIAAPTPALAASQAFCLSLGCVQDCGTCHQGGCACCGPGNQTTSADKICTQDCSATYCNDTIRAAHCGTISPSSACNV